MSSTREGTGAAALVAAELASLEGAIPAAERELSAADDELSRAHVIRRHVARNPERFAPHEREDVFERVERLTGRRQELAAQLKAARDRLSLLENLQAALEHEQSKQPEDSSSVQPARGIDVHQAIEAERLRIARELHDGPAQVMSNLVLEADILERLLKRDPALLEAELQQFRNAVTNAVADIRRFMFDLRPGSLDDLGLVATLRRFTSDWQQQSGITCRFNLTGEDLRVPPPVEETVFRIIQEALTNVRRHAGARTVEIDLEVRADLVRFRVRDDGKGFDPATPPAGPRRLGLVGMAERAAAVGGKLQVRSQPGGGTEVEGDFRAG